MRKIILITKFLVFVCISLQFSLLATCCALAAEHKTVFPVFFATDRFLDPSAASLNYTNIQQPPDNLTYGIKNVVLVGDASIQESAERLNGLGWWSLLAPNDPAPPTRSSTAKKELLFEDIKKVIDAGPPDRPLVIYIHGCCSNFDKTATDAARLSRSMAAPVLAYAWAAIPPLTAYSQNGPAQTKSAKRFNDFMRDLELVVPPSRIILVGYSMGNRFLLDSLKFRYWNYGKNPDYPKYKAACFMCADVPLKDIASQLSGIVWDSERTVVTRNDTDPALGISKVVNGFMTRLGAPGSEFRLLQGSKGNLHFFDIQPILKYKHDLPVELLAQVLRGNTTPYAPYKLVPKRPDTTSVVSGVTNKVHTTIKE